MRIWQIGEVIIPGVYGEYAVIEWNGTSFKQINMWRDLSNEKE
jgi:hypothetical protein